MSHRIGDWFQSVKGRRIYPLDPRPEDVDIDEIAHSLSHICRFNGHVPGGHYSVAEHSVYVMCDLKRPEDTSLCMCGHVADEHVMRRGRAECTVCECCQFDWDIDAEEAAATAPKRAARTPRPPQRRPPA